MLLKQKKGKVPLVFLHLFLCAGIVVGFERTTFVVNETDGRVEVCVNVTVPASHNLNGVDLTVETQDGTASMSNKIMLTTSLPK